MALRAETGGQFTNFPDEKVSFCLFGIGRIKLNRGFEIYTSESKTEIIITSLDQILGEPDGIISELEHIDGPTSQPGWKITLTEPWEMVRLRVVRNLDQKKVELKISHREILPTVIIE